MSSPVCRSVCAAQRPIVMRRAYAVPAACISRPTLRNQRLSTLSAQAKKKKDEPKAEEVVSEDSEEAAAPAEVAEEAEEGQLDTCQKLVATLKAGDYEDATFLAEAVVAEVGALAAIVEAAEADTKATRAALENQVDQYKRLQADFQNFRTRSEREAAAAKTNIKKSIVEDLLPVIDGFDSATTQVKTTTPGEEKINGSYQGLYRQMVNIFKDMGLEVVPTEGTEFDPEVHDAIMREESTEFEDGFVSQEFRKGFKFGDVLVRPAMVKVAVAPADAPAAEPEPVEETSDAK